MGYAEPTTPESALEKPNPDLDDVLNGMSRAEAAVAMKVAGADYSEIASVLGYATVPAARSAVERALAATVTDEDRSTMRAIANRRIERLLRAVQGKAIDPDNPEQLSAIRTSLALLDRHARMNGYDAPTEVAVINPSERQVADFLQGFADRMRDSLPKEYDIIDAEEVEDEPQAG